MSNKKKTQKINTREPKNPVNEVQLDSTETKGKKGPRNFAILTFLFQLVGTILLLGAWITDNVTKKKSEAEKQKLEFIRSIEMNLSLTKDIYEAESMELGAIYKKDTANRKQYLHCLHSYCEAIINEDYIASRAIIEDKDSGDIKGQIDSINMVNRLSTSMNNSLERTQNDAGMMREFAALHAWEGNYITNYRDIINNKSAEAEEKNKRFGDLFIFAYIFGSLFIIVSIVIKFLGD
jgi:hypothetical protein